METDLVKFANQIRVATLKTLLHLGFGHFGGSMSIVETLAALYGKVMKIDPQHPDWDERDYFVLSKGHGGPALYSTLALKGFFPLEQLQTLNQNQTLLPSHPDRLKTKGVDATTGSLGQGLSIATGIAFSHHLRGMENRTFCIVGDGELNEGQCWEALQFIAHHRLTNLTVLVDYNKMQLDGTLSAIIEPFSLAEKFKAFGFDCIEVDGKDVQQIASVLTQKPEGKPKLIVLNTIKGQGVPYLEGLKNSHHLRLDDAMKQSIQQAILDLEAKYA
ncbi:transketolase [Gallibacterium salpingitidis]|uniref:Carbohydrate degradation protein n=1 Tax=Gallibacterium salpingitidis TaxID=505341 RepID=A0A1A7P409_9PAST|nr:transketolase [Gallibacterium salpingitidis]OBW96466.1 carbohydrate degradation protein [Gallibacterium salpingitidis]WKS99376.1 transketolase [Gallibacterium salpingitidis]